MGLNTARFFAAIKGERLSPQIVKSNKYKHWVSIEDIKRCKTCENLHGKIWEIVEKPIPSPPVHDYCRCKIEEMNAIFAGTATINGNNGADWLLKYEKTLPDYYIAKEDALKSGWRPSKWPSNFVPQKMITAGVYKNRNGHLPDSPGRTWYEADINYISGKRNTQRIVWSNDGLIFITYDHYKTFYEII